MIVPQKSDPLFVLTAFAVRTYFLCSFLTSLEFESQLIFVHVFISLLQAVELLIPSIVGSIDISPIKILGLPGCFAIRQTKGVILLPFVLSRGLGLNRSGVFCRNRYPRSHLLSQVLRNQAFVFSTGEKMADDDVVARKKIFRKQLRTAIKELTLEDTLIQSQQVWDRVIALPEYQSAKSVGLFLSMPQGEINTDSILQHAIENGKDVYVPQVGANFEKCDMELLKVVLDTPDPIFHKSWPKNKWKIPEPPPDMPIVAAKPGELELLIVPGLGFDKHANRLGQGKGYYDRFIARMTSDGAVLPLVAVALEAQFVEDDIPVAAYDRPMDKVVLPSRIIVPECN